MKASATASRFVHDIANIDGDDINRFGGKATGLARMTREGIPIPPAFVIGTDCFHDFRSNGGSVGDGLMAEVNRALRRLEASSGKTFAGPGRPLLVSVRSGAAISMPGM